MNSQVVEIILRTIDSNKGTVSGTEYLQHITNIRRRSYLLKCVRAIQHDGLITIIPSIGGRGRKTIYKRNPNQPGLPRKR